MVAGLQFPGHLLPSSLFFLLIPLFGESSTDCRTPAPVSPPCTLPVPDVWNWKPFEDHDPVSTTLFSDTALNFTFMSPRGDTRVSNEQTLFVVSQVSTLDAAGELCVNVQVKCGTKEMLTFNQTTNNSLIPRPLRWCLEAQVMSHCKGQELHINVHTFNANHSAQQSLNLRVVSDDLARVYLILSTCSAFASLILIFLFLRYPLLRKWPSDIIFWRTCANLLVSAQFMWLNTWEVADEVNRELCPPVLVFVTQFALLASFNWYFVLALNTYYSISNPFVNPQSKSRAYHIFVWGTAAVSAAVVVPSSAYRPDFQLCWIKKENGVNWRNWVVLFGPLGVYVLFGLIGLFYSCSKLGDARLRDRTLAKRKESLRQTQIYVIVFTLYSVAGGIVWFRVYLLDLKTEDGAIVQNATLSFSFAIICSVLGLLDCLTWCTIQWRRIRKACMSKKKTGLAAVPLSPGANKESSVTSERGKQSEILAMLDAGADSEDIDDKFADISDALRDEVIFHTTQGIQQCVTVDIAVKTVTEGGYLCGGSLDVKVKEITDLDFRFRSFAPERFAALRQDIFGLCNDDYGASFVLDASSQENIAANFSEGASGSFFFFSKDKRYMVKTLNSAEKHLMLAILDDYIAHMGKYPHSRMCKFFGVYSIRMHGQEQHVAVMNNFLRIEPQGADQPVYKLDEIYDLKGSSVNRHGKPNKKTGRTGVLKDSDFKKTILIGPQEAMKMADQIARDAEFLASCGIMDYSLLVGIHNCTEPRQRGSHCNALRGQFTEGSDPNIDWLTLRGDGRAIPAAVIVGPGVYHIGIIDMLQSWNCDKVSEQWAKIICRCHCNDYKEVSAVEPIWYRDRFILMIDDVFGIQRAGKRDSRDELE